MTNYRERSKGKDLVEADIVLGGCRPGRGGAGLGRVPAFTRAAGLLKSVGSVMTFAAD